MISSMVPSSARLSRGRSFTVIQPADLADLGRLVGPAEDDDPIAELGDFHHVVRNIEKSRLRKGRFDFIQDGLPGGFIHVGQTFVHDQKAELLKQVAQQVHPVALPHGQLGIAHAHEVGQTEMIDQFIPEPLAARRGGFFQVPAHGGPSGQALAVVSIQAGAVAGGLHPA